MLLPTYLHSSFRWAYILSSCCCSLVVVGLRNRCGFFSTVCLMTANFLRIDTLIRRSRLLSPTAFRNFPLSAPGPHTVDEVDAVTVDSVKDNESSSGLTFNAVDPVAAIRSSTQLEVRKSRINVKTQPVRAPLTYQHVRHTAPVTPI